MKPKPDLETSDVGNREEYEDDLDGFAGSTQLMEGSPPPPISSLHFNFVDIEAEAPLLDFGGLGSRERTFDSPDGHDIADDLLEDLEREESKAADERQVIDIDNLSQDSQGKRSGTSNVSTMGRFMSKMLSGRKKSQKGSRNTPSSFRLTEFEAEGENKYENVTVDDLILQAQGLGNFSKNREIGSGRSRGAFSVRGRPNGSNRSKRFRRKSDGVIERNREQGSNRQKRNLSKSNNTLQRKKTSNAIMRTMKSTLTRKKRKPENKENP